MNDHKYFGTDGIRGKVGFTPITPNFILKLGLAAGRVLSKKLGSGRIIIGKDTRISSYMLESALEAGLLASGICVSLTGPIPTPAIAYLTRLFHAEAGIVISASHNPFYDNGVKFFSINGTKLSYEVETAIEIELEKPSYYINSKYLGKSNHIINAQNLYIKFCKKTLSKNLNLERLKIVVDCANGATYKIAPNIFRQLGAKVISIGCQPNGFNINDKYGTTDICQLQNQVLIEKADVGIAYDGDGDRVIMVDHLGHKVDGDQILYIIARDRLNHGQLIGGAVGTIMSNMGLELAFKKLDIPFIRTNVGDKYILETMRDKGWNIGAENSGHIILMDKTTTGDGIIASLQVLSAMIENHVKLYDLYQDINLFPQTIINVYFNGKNNPLESSLMKKAQKNIEQQLEGQGRILLRKSGTEPVIRVMVEGKDAILVNHLAQKISHIIQDNIF